ncbi:hypothetical protein C461_04487 [Halorubrum aidingense JCM 13560]|uniref:Uncharacterized protein n=1 Tax=Halorubrum aidingense JCM 13560 TaxID=1230454 RepID=M0PG17_9EURY|nr:hypothetical protein [Halorubrum aidingense]EMA68858.1 hypothetical protein C461_04487 [Halorubrum aidingense JCM 13560]
MSVDRQTDLEVDLDDNRAVATVVEKRTLEIDDLFNDDGELRLWQDTAGWSGYVRETVDSESHYYSVNTRFDEDEWIEKIRCGEQAVRDAVETHIEDPEAGRSGRFVRRCSPP